MQEPTTCDASGRPVLKFGRMLVGRSAKLQIALRNNGQLPATARMEAELHPAFTVLDGPVGNFSVQPGRGAAFTVHFSPSAVGPQAHELRLKVGSGDCEEADGAGQGRLQLCQPALLACCA